MKRIAIVQPRMGLGGVERSLLGLLRHAPRQELDITLILLSPGGELLDEVPEWVHIQYAPNGGKAESLRSHVSEALKKLRMQRLFTFAKSVYHKLGPRLQHRADGGGEAFDVAVAYSDGLATWYTASAVRAAKKAAFVHTDFLRAGYDARSERPVYESFDTIYLCSAPAREHFLEVLPGFSGRAEVLPNCVDGSRVRRLAQEPCRRLDADAVRLITVSRLSPEKGLEKIPVLLKRLREDGLKAHWYVVGGGPGETSLKAGAARLGVAEDLTLLGPKTNPYPYMAQCDVYVQPSNYEGYCIALAEARALCLPCAACAFSGAAEQIENGVTGFVTGMDASGLYEGVRPLVESESLRGAIRENLAGQGQDGQPELYSRWWRGL